MSASGTLNECCPWSGKPVQEDSTTHYRGRRVGFCNPGCRDKFEAAVTSFDSLLDVEAEAAEPVFTPYRPRRMRFAGYWRAGHIDVKAYSIQQVDDPANLAKLVSSAERYTQTVLPGAATESGDDHGAAYAIVHKGEAGCWLLIHWWAHQDIAMALLAFAEHDSTAFSSQAGRHFHACVWEHVLIHHERNAWVRHVLGGRHSVQNYLADVMEHGDY